MKRSWILWLCAFLMTAASAIYQRRTGPSYPVRGRVDVGGTLLAYELSRSHSITSDCPVSIATGGAPVEGVLFWKRHKTADDWRRVPLTLRDGALSAELPRQPAAGKLDYSIELRKGDAAASVPASGPIVIRFKGDVPVPVLVVHIIGIFGAMLISTRAGLEALAGQPELRRYTLWTCRFLLVGGLVLGPVVQKYAFDAFWTGWPFGSDLTDNKTLVAFLAWGGAWISLFKSRNPRRWMVFAALVTLVVFLIPHSVLGSEYDYSKQQAGG